MVKAKNAREFVDRKLRHEIVQRDAHAGCSNCAPLPGERSVDRPPGACVDHLTAIGHLQVFLVNVINAFSRRLRDVVVKTA